MASPTSVQNSELPAATATANQNQNKLPCLYVGDLAPNTVENDLLKIFHNAGRIISIRVCRERNSHQSLGYAYVNFAKFDDAERALETLNYTKIDGRPIRLMWSHRNPILRRSNDGNIFVKHLDPLIDSKTLQDYFSVFGTILSCKVCTDEYGRSRGYGFVHFDSPEAAAHAISEMNNSSLYEKQLVVEVYKKKLERNSTETQFTNLYCRGFPPSWTVEKIGLVFSKYGEVTSKMIKPSGKDTRVAFINFATNEEARAAIDALHNVVIRDDEIQEGIKDDSNSTSSTRENGLPDGLYVLYVVPHQAKIKRNEILKHEYASSTTSNGDARSKSSGSLLFVKNFGFEKTEEDLERIFQEIGPLSLVRVKKNERGESLGFGFVDFLSHEDAVKAVTSLHGKMIDNKPLYVGLYEPKEERERRLQEGRSRGMRTLIHHPQGMTAMSAAMGGGQPMYSGAGGPPPSGMQMGGHPGGPPHAMATAFPPRGPMMTSFGHPNLMPWRATGPGGQFNQHPATAAMRHTVPMNMYATQPVGMAHPLSVVPPAAAQQQPPPHPPTSTTVAGGGRAATINRNAAAAVNNSNNNSGVINANNSNSANIAVSASSSSGVGSNNSGSTTTTTSNNNAIAAGTSPLVSGNNSAGGGRPAANLINATAANNSSNFIAKGGNNNQPTPVNISTTTPPNATAANNHISSNTAGTTNNNMISSPPPPPAVAITPTTTTTTSGSGGGPPLPHGTNTNNIEQQHLPPHGRLPLHADLIQQPNIGNANNNNIPSPPPHQNVIQTPLISATNAQQHPPPNQSFQHNNYTFTSQARNRGESVLNRQQLPTATTTNAQTNIIPPQQHPVTTNITHSSNNRSTTIPHDADDIQHMGVDEQRLFFGEQLYYRILNLKPDNAGKITGMLLEMETAELMKLTKSDDLLSKRVEEACKVLDSHRTPQSSSVADH